MIDEKAITASLATLGRALVSARAALTKAAQATDAAPGDDDEEASVFSVVEALGFALSNADGFLPAVEALTRRGGTGETFLNRQRARLDQLEQAAGQAVALSAELGALKAREPILRAQAVCVVRLKREVIRLQRIQRLAGHLDVLREARASLEEVAQRAAAVQAEKQAFADAAHRVVALTVEQRLALGERAQKQEAEARASIAKLHAELTRHEELERTIAAEVARLEGDLKDATKRYELLRAVHQELIDPAVRYAEADREVVAALQGTVAGRDGALAADLQSVEHTVAEIMQRLTDVDRALKRALEVHDDIARVERRVRLKGDVT